MNKGGIAFFYLNFIFVISFMGQCRGQENYDSLNLLLKNSQGKQKVNISIKLSKLVSDTSPSLGFVFACDALRESTYLNYPKGKADSRILIGNYFKIQGKYLLALKFYLGSQQLYANLKDREGILNGYQAIGSLSLLLRDYNDAIIYFQKGLILAGSLHKFTWVGIFLRELGKIEQKKGNLEIALGKYKQALLALQQGGEKESVLSVYNSIGSIYLDQGRYDDAIEFYTQLLNIREPAILSQLGSIYTPIAHAYDQKGLYQKAISYNFKALAVRKKLNQMEAYNSSIINIAGDYFFLNKIDSAWIYMSEGLKIAKANNRPYLLENGYRILYKYFNSRDDFKTALFYYQKFAAIGDSIIIEKNKGDIAILEGNQRIQNIEEGNVILGRENEIQLLSLKNQRFQIIFLQVILSFAFIMIIFSFFQYIRNIRAKKDIQQIYGRMSKEVIDLEEANKLIREQEGQYRFLAENSVDFITRFDKNMNRIYASPASVRVFGYTPEEILGKSTNDLTHPDFYDFAIRNFQEMLLEKTSKQFIYLAPRKNGEIFWVESVLNPIFNNNTGELEEVVEVTRDIQERKIKEMEIMEGTKQKENLLKEIHHRVKNNFAILVSLINMQKEQTKTPELIQSLTDLQLRIRTMALVHEMLYRSKDFENISFSDYIRSLSAVITGTFNRRDIRLNFDVQDITMDIDTAIPLGLIINEILSNGYKHAFPNNQPGSIWIGLKEQPDNSELCLTVRDDGIGLPKDFDVEKCKSMGFQIVLILVKQIEGIMTVINEPGAMVSIIFSRAK